MSWGGDAVGRKVGWVVWCRVGVVKGSSSEKLFGVCCYPCVQLHSCSQAPQTNPALKAELTAASVPYPAHPSSIAFSTSPRLHAAATSSGRWPLALRTVHARGQAWRGGSGCVGGG